MKIVLLGYMASGKSTVGQTIAKNRKLKFIDLDAYIIEKENKSIPQIFSEKGEIYFRKIEHRYLKEILEFQEDLILSLGGGTPCYSNNMLEVAKKASISIYLKGSIKTLVDRILLHKQERPLVADLDAAQIPEFIAKHLFERRYFYEQASKTVLIDGKSMAVVCKEVESLLD